MRFSLSRFLTRSVFLLLVLLGLSATKLLAQPVDKIIATVGGELVLFSEVEAQYMQLKDREEFAPQLSELRCLILDQVLQKKMFLHRSKLDSLVVTDQQVQNELDRKMEYFIAQFGSEAEIERFYGKTVREIKSEFFETVKEQLLIEQMTSKVTGATSVTPAEVKDFYNKIPADSLPYYDAEFEIAQIVMYPKISAAERRETRERIEKIRKDIHNGSRFEVEAIAYSKDLGSAKKGGRLGLMKADNFVPEYAAASLSLKRGQDTIIETKYGFHLLQLLDRKGDMVDTRHILLTPSLTDADRNIVINKLDSVRTLIGRDSITFESLAYQVSEDQETKNRGGYLVDAKTNSSRLPVGELDAKVFYAVEKLPIGGVSAPQSFTSVDMKEGYRIFYLKSKTPPHRASLSADYNKIKAMAEEHKKIEVMDQWFTKQLKTTSIYVDPEYTHCHAMDKWRSGLNARTDKK